MAAVSGLPVVGDVDMQTLNVELGERSYPIYIGAGLLSQGDLLRRHVAGQQVMVVTNETIAPLYLSPLRSALDGLQCAEVVLPDGEQHKTLQVMESIYTRLLEEKHNRTTTLVALGGGVVGDMTGFAAASYQRGVNFIQVPTTLLSQVDSSVGGKTGVNHPLGKNMIGAFHQPQCVIADTDTLGTLPPRELSAGIAEVIKYGLICDPDFYSWIEANIDALVSCDAAVVAEAVYRSCQDKAAVVARDERESGVRAILNLGHTFGHAIETAQGYGQWLHGEAVAVGMLMAVDLSCRLGWIADAERERLQSLLMQAGLPVSAPAMTQDQFFALMSVDKKVLDGRLRLVLLKAVGDAIVTSDINRQDVAATLTAFGVAR